MAKEKRAGKGKKKEKREKSFAMTGKIWRYEARILIEDIIIVTRLSNLYLYDLRRNSKLSTEGYSGKDIRSKCEKAIKIAEDTARKTRNSRYPRKRLTKSMEKSRNIPPRVKRRNRTKPTEAELLQERKNKYTWSFKDEVNYNSKKCYKVAETVSKMIV